jgi:hypothetical protein
MFRVVRVSGTPPSGDPIEVQTPIPGLRVEIVEEVQTTPVAIHEVLTDKEGRPLTEIQVDSSSDITIQSVDEKIAKFAASGPASEFADPLAPAIVATPMIEPLVACRTQVEGTPVVEFSYNNMNEAGVNALVPITGLTPDLYRTPETPLDDLLLNSIRNSDNEVIPDVMYRGSTPEETKQLFINGENSFRVTYDTGFGPLTWSFIGKETVIDSSTTLCEGEGVIRCEPLSPALIERLVTELRSSVSGTLRTASKVMKLGRSPYLKSSARAIRDIRRQANDLLGSYVCPQGAMMPQSCRAIRFPASELQRTHAGIFSKPSPVRPAMFEKLGRTYNRRYQRFLDTGFPRDIVVCRK